MSGQSIVMFVSLLAISFAANRAQESTVTALRTPASVSMHKEITLLEKPLLKHTHKGRGPLSATVELLGAAPVTAGDVFVLRGTVLSESDLGDVEFTWTLPAGVEIVNGEMSSVISYLGEGKPYLVEITLRQLSAENERVALRVRGKEDGMKFGDTAFYHTLDQQELEASRAELKKTVEDYQRAPGQLKIFE